MTFFHYIFSIAFVLYHISSVLKKAVFISHIMTTLFFQSPHTFIKIIIIFLYYDLYYPILLKKVNLNIQMYPWFYVKNNYWKLSCIFCWGFLMIMSDTSDELFEGNTIHCWNLAYLGSQTFSHDISWNDYSYGVLHLCILA